MQYSIIKDDNPIHTVERIKKILEELKINVEEQYFTDETSKYAPVSLRVYIKGHYNIGTNGKGTCLANAQASAYAEFIERLQNMILLPFSTNEYYPFLDQTLCKCSNKIEFKNNVLNKYFKNKVSKLFNLKEIKKPKQYSLLPFYSVKNKQVYNILENIISFSKGSNGCAAGNTLEEAIVQGLSEICERYALREVFQKKLSLPDIPKEMYIKYDNIKKMLTYFEESGYSVYIKDASLNGIVPVVCSIIKNNKNKRLHFIFGAHPSLPIAIERSLTEFAQGIIPSDYINNPYAFPYYSKVKFRYTQIKNLIRSIAHIKICFENNKYLTKQFFKNPISYCPSSTIWADNNKKLNNKELLKVLCKIILNISEDIFIRDVSFLGFPSINIFVPNICELFEFNKKNIEILLLFDRWMEYCEDNKKNTDIYNIDSLLKLAEAYTFLDVFTRESASKFDAPFEYIAFLCALAKKDRTKINKYINIMIAQNEYYNYYTAEQIIMFNIIKKYFNLKQKYKDEIIINQKLSKYYKKQDIKSAFECINNISFESILNIIMLPKKKTRMNNTADRIAKMSKNNIPNQLNLKDLF